MSSFQLKKSCKHSNTLYPMLYCGSLSKWHLASQMTPPLKNFLIPYPDRKFAYVVMTITSVSFPGIQIISLPACPVF